jgi:ferrochelatase
MPRFEKEPEFDSSNPPCTGVLLTNLGTPDAPTPAALRRYLAEFLSDPRVIEKPRWLWWLVLHGIILNIRPRKAAKAYESVWTDNGSPLMEISRKQESALQKALDEKSEQPVKVVLAMRYGNPSIRTGLEILKKANAQKIIVLPLYPQYSATTVASTFDAVMDVLKYWRNVPEMHFIREYYRQDAYINALTASIQEHWQQHGQPDKLLFSFHGLPKRYVDAGDPYRCHCEATAMQIASELQLKKDQWLLTFQSRFGPEEWLKPYTDHTLEGWGKAGVKRVDVISPGFSADCLETLEEIGVENRDIFIEAGGQEYHYIPCLNDRTDHIDFLSRLVLQHV